jgi:HEAT repeat protein
MKETLVAVLAAAVFFPLQAGCRQKEPPLAGGKPVKHWIEALQDPDPKQRKAAVMKLGNVGTTDTAVMPALVGALKDADAGVRCEVILALLKCAPDAQEAVPDLAELKMKDRDAKVRDFATKALDKLVESK